MSRGKRILWDGSPVGQHTKDSATQSPHAPKGTTSRFVRRLRSAASERARLDWLNRVSETRGVYFGAEDTQRFVVLLDKCGKGIASFRGASIRSAIDAAMKAEQEET